MSLVSGEKVRGHPNEWLSLFANFLPPILFLGCDGDDRDRPTSTDRPPSTDTFDLRVPATRPSPEASLHEINHRRYSKKRMGQHNTRNRDRYGSGRQQTSHLKRRILLQSSGTGAICGHHWSINSNHLLQLLSTSPTRLRLRRPELTQQPRKRQQEAGNA